LVRRFGNNRRENYVSIKITETWAGRTCFGKRAPKARTTGWPRLRFFCAPIWRKKGGIMATATKSRLRKVNALLIKEGRDCDKGFTTEFALAVDAKHARSLIQREVNKQKKLAKIHGPVCTVYKYSTDGVKLQFPGRFYTAVAVKKPDGWEPRHSLDVRQSPEEASYNGHGYEWNLSFNNLEWSDRESAFRDASKWNSVEPLQNADEIDWHVVVELGVPFDRMLVNVVLHDGIGFLKVRNLTVPAEVVRPTANEVSRLAKAPFARKVVA
jgi:hypothetical protein